MVLSFLAFFLVFSSFLTLVSLLPLEQALAQSYAPLESLGDGGTVSTENPASYFGQLFWITLGIAAVLAVLMITIGGIRYMTSEAFDTKSAAKNQITAAVFGLILAFASLFILETINPDILNLNIFKIVEKTETLQGDRPSLDPGVAEPDFEFNENYDRLTEGDAQEEDDFFNACIEEGKTLSCEICLQKDGAGNCTNKQILCYKQEEGMPWACVATQEGVRGKVDRIIHWITTTRDYCPSWIPGCD